MIVAARDEAVPRRGFRFAVLVGGDTYSGNALSFGVGVGIRPAYVRSVCIFYSLLSFSVTPSVIPS